MESDESNDDFSDRSSDNYEQPRTESRDEGASSFDDDDLAPNDDIVQKTIETVTDWSSPSTSFQPRKSVVNQRINASHIRRSDSAIQIFRKFVHIYDTVH